MGLSQRFTCASLPRAFLIATVAITLPFPGRVGIKSTHDVVKDSRRLSSVAAYVLLALQTACSPCGRFFVWCSLPSPKKKKTFASFTALLCAGRYESTTTSQQTQPDQKKPVRAHKSDNGEDARQFAAAMKARIHGSKGRKSRKSSSSHSTESASKDRAKQPVDHSQEDASSPVDRARQRQEKRDAERL